MAPPLLLLQDIHLTFGGTPLLDGAGLSVSERERLCLVGRNGSGKSTLLKIAAGSVPSDSGRRFLQPGVTIRYLPQEPDLSAFDTVLAYTASGLAPGEDPFVARMMLEGLGLTGEEDPRRLSGGEIRRAALAWALAPDPDILLLDEPTNHLDLPTIEWLEDTLAGARAAIVLISHDRRFLERLSRTTLWLDRGETRLLDKNFAAFEEWRDEFLEQEALERHKMDRKLAREQDWIVHGVSGRRKRNQGRLRALQDLRQERRDLRQSVGMVKLEASTATPTSGKQVIEAKAISKSFGDRPIVKTFSTRILRGDRVGIIGANGAGKTTLLKMLTGVLEPDSGTVKVGNAVELVSLDQQRSTLDPAVSLSAALTGGNSDNVIIDGKPRHVISYMRDFLFTPEQAKTAVGRLSGGERGRLMLARAMAQPSNLLVLDEPTNDLDLETLDLLQEMLTDYAGTVLLVSHDRDFIDRVVTSVIVSEGGGHWGEYAGGYSDMLAQKGPGIAEARAVKSGKSSGAATPGAPAKKQSGGFSFKDRDTLGKLPGRIATLQKTIAALQADLANPDLYRREPAKFETLTAALTGKTAELEAAEEQWLALEMRREAAGG